MHQNYTIPSVDPQNPFYCPTITAAAYLNSLRRQNVVNTARKTKKPRVPARSSRQTDSKIIVSSFSHILGQALLQEDECADYGTPKTFGLTTTRNTRNTAYKASPRFNFSLAGFDYCPAPDQEDVFSTPPWELAGLTPVSCNITSDAFPLSDNLIDHNALKIHPSHKRKRSESFSDLLHGPAKYGRSFTAPEESQELSQLTPEDSIRFLDLCKAQNFQYSPAIEVNRTIEEVTTEERLNGRIRSLEDTLYGPPVGTETPRGVGKFISSLDSLLPGMRLKERLENLEIPTHQSIVDFLGENGYLNTRVLSFLRTSEIRGLALTTTLGDEDGLNIGGRDVFPVFSKPNSFLFLSWLSFSGTHVQDSDLVYIHHLPRLSTLLLNNTGIGNEAIYLLVSLKRTLTHLSIATNPDIDDDAVPALLLLSKLSMLSILDTSIGMVGLRRLAYTIDSEQRVIDIEITEVCETYVDNMHLKYLVDLAPPLITNPALCARLSAGALKRNLVAHASINPAIMAAGTKAEMKERLEGILTIREKDLLVRSMIFGSDESL